MREILFRGKKWEKSVFDETDWIYGSLIDSGNHSQIAIYPWFDGASSMSVRQLVYSRMETVIPETIGQYTGLPDKNGNKIFEGDIVKFGDITGIINYSFGCYCVKTNKPDWKSRNNPAIDIVFNEYPNEIEIIGNIHDNPELLEVK